MGSPLVLPIQIIISWNLLHYNGRCLLFHHVEAGGGAAVIRAMPIIPVPLLIVNALLVRQCLIRINKFAVAVRSRRIARSVRLKIPRRVKIRVQRPPHLPHGPLLPERILQILLILHHLVLVHWLPLHLVLIILSQRPLIHRPVRLRTALTTLTIDPLLHRVQNSWLRTSMVERSSRLLGRLYLLAILTLN